MCGRFWGKVFLVVMDDCNDTLTENCEGDVRFMVIEMGDGSWKEAPPGRMDVGVGEEERRGEEGRREEEDLGVSGVGEEKGKDNAVQAEVWFGLWYHRPQYYFVITYQRYFYFVFSKNGKQVVVS